MANETRLQKAERELREIKNQLEARVRERTQELQAANDTLQSLIEAAPQAIILLNLSGKVQIWNRAAEKIFGWTASEVIGGTLPYMLHEKREEDQRIFERTIAGNAMTNLEVRRAHRDGSQLDLLLSVLPLRDSTGAVSGCLSFVTDITEQKKLENQLFRAQRLESIGMLASGIAHDLNNILAPILMSIQLFKDKFRDESSQETLSMLESSTKRGANLVKHVLTFARGYEGEFMRVQLKHVLLDVEKIVAQTFPKSIRVVTEIPTALSAVKADPTQLHQVFMNLCVNARDAMPNGGTLLIRAENVIVDENYVSLNSEAKTGPFVMVEVADTGKGIPPVLQDRIFEPFFTTKSLGMGTGLGLSTAQAIVKNHGGFINVYSEPGRGTSFKVYLSTLSAATAQEDQGLQPALPAGNNELILVVDDEAAVRDICKLTLEGFGYRVLVARNGADGLRIYATHTSEIAVVISDMNMPIMNGGTMMDAMRAINADVKILSSSGLSHYVETARGLTGSIAFISKPYTAEQLLRKIAELLRGNK
jgi:two-component system cell cycle sensor histidine kinase/response regulator CckA